MLNDCGKPHKPDYENSCCIRHLIEMSRIAEIQTLTKTYSRLLILKLNHHYKTNSLNFTTLKFDMVKSLLEILSKYISHFFMLKKYDYSKLLGIVALKLIRETAYRENIEIIRITTAINNNIACVYEARKKYNKALKYLNLNKMYLNSNNNIDYAIYYNNLVRISFKSGITDELSLNVEKIVNYLNEEITRIKYFQMKNQFDLNSPNVTNNNINTMENIGNNIMIYRNLETISFMYFNCGLYMEKMKLENNARETFYKGYEFSMSTLGEMHFYTMKFLNKIKLEETKKSLNNTIGNNSYFSSKKSLDIKKEFISDSDYNDTANKKKKKAKKKEIDLEYKINTIFEYIKQQKKSESRSSNERNRNYNSDTEQSSDKKIKEEKIYRKYVKNLKGFISGVVDDIEINNTLKKGKTHSLIDEVLQEYELEKKNAKVPQVNMKETKLLQPNIDENNGCATSRKVPKIKKLFQRVLGREPEKQEKPKGKFAQLIQGLTEDINDKDEKKNDLVSNNVNDGFNIDIQTEKTQDNFVFKPYYVKDENYTKTVSNLVSNITKRKLKFIKGTNEMDTLFLGKAIFNGTKNENNNDNEDMSCEIQINETEETNYEFKPFYNQDKDFVMDEKNKKERKTEAKKVKFMKGSHTESGVDDISQLVKNQQNSNGNDEDLKEISISGDINICSAEDTGYEFTPFYHKDEDFVMDEKSRQERITVVKEVKIVRRKHSENPLTDISKLVKQNNSDNFIVSEIDLNKIELISRLNSFNKSEKEKNVVNVSEFLTRLFNDTKSIPEKNIIYLLLYKEEQYQIYIEINKEESNIDFSLYRKPQNKGLPKKKSPSSQPPPLFEEENFVSKLNLSFDKIKRICEKIIVEEVMPKWATLEEISSVNGFIRKVLIYYLSIVEKNGKLTIGILPKPNSIFDKDISFDFMKKKTKCQVDFICVDRNVIRILITNVNVNSNYLSIDCFCDSTSFNDIFSPLINFGMRSASVDLVNSFKFNEKQIAKDGLILILVKKIQEFLKEKFPSQSFEDVAPYLKNLLFQYEVKKKCTVISMNVLSLNIDEGDVEKKNQIILRKVCLKDDSNPTKVGEDITQEYDINYLNRVFFFYEDEKRLTEIVKNSNCLQLQMIKFFILNSSTFEKEEERKVKIIYNLKYVLDSFDLMIHFSIVNLGKDMLNFGRLSVYQNWSGMTLTIIYLYSLSDKNEVIIKLLNNYDKPTLKDFFANYIKKFIKPLDDSSNINLNLSLDESSICEDNSREKVCDRFYNMNDIMKGLEEYTRTFEN